MSELDSQKPNEGCGGGAGSGTVSAAVPQDSAVVPRLLVFTTSTQKEGQQIKASYAALTSHDPDSEENAGANDRPAAASNASPTSPPATPADRSEDGHTSEYDDQISQEEAVRDVRERIDREPDGQDSDSKSAFAGETADAASDKVAIDELFVFECASTAFPETSETSEKSNDTNYGFMVPPASPLPVDKNPELPLGPAAIAPLDEPIFIEAMRMMDDPLDPLFIIEAIRKSRNIQIAHESEYGLSIELEIKWRNYPESENTWESYPHNKSMVGKRIVDEYLLPILREHGYDPFDPSSLKRLSKPAKLKSEKSTKGNKGTGTDGKRKRKAKEPIDFVPAGGRSIDMRKGEVDDWERHRTANLLRGARVFKRFGTDWFGGTVVDAYQGPNDTVAVLTLFTDDDYVLIPYTTLVASSAYNTAESVGEVRQMLTQDEQDEQDKEDKDNEAGWMTIEFHCGMCRRCCNCWEILLGRLRILL